MKVYFIRWLFKSSVLYYLLITYPLSAQIVPDATLPVNSRVTSSGDTSIIEKGTQAGSNLFHSFNEFSIPTGGKAVFNNALDVQNIFSRVTGGKVSNIDGLIKANGRANLFFLNPNGIIFGSNARLEIGGSFFGTSANSINFADGFHFGATNPQTTLLTISVPVGLQFGSNAGKIVNSSTATGSSGVVGLQVQTGKIGLVGEEVVIPGGHLTASDGIELGSVGANNTISLTPTNSSWLLGYQGISDFGDIRLSDGATIAVAGDGKASIAINAKNIDIFGESNLQAGITASEFLDTKAGDITLNASGIVSINNSTITNQVFGRGNGGNININTRSLFFKDNAQLSTTSFGQGNAGNITINALDTVSLNGLGNNGKTEIAANLEGLGNGGKITVNAPRVDLLNGATIVAHTLGQGNAGDVEITATDSIVIDGVGDGVGESQLGSGVGSQVFANAVGNGGAIALNAPIVSISGGGTVVAHTLGQGDAGNIEITAANAILIDGADSGVGSVVYGDAIGKGGVITLNAPKISVSGGAIVSAHTFGQGNAGSIEINAKQVFLDGLATNQESSGLGSAAFGTARGNAGQIVINTDSLDVTDSAALLVATRGQGDAGSITINALGTVNFDGVGSNGRSSNAFSTVEQGSTGNGGEINITANHLSISNGAVIGGTTRARGNGGNINIKVNFLELLNGGQILTTSRAGGNAGNIKVNASDKIAISGSDLSFPERIARIGRPTVRNQGAASGLYADTDTNSTGKGGDINIMTRSLFLSNGGQINASTLGQGNSGDVTILTDSLRLDNGAIAANSISGQGGNINLTLSDSSEDVGANTSMMILRNNSTISTRAGTEQSGGGNGGNININTSILTVSENSSINANAFQGRGGEIQITSQALFRSPDSGITASSQLGINGRVRINTLDIEPSQGVVELPTEIIDLEGLIANSCIERRPVQKGSFVITGSGGLPTLPEDPANSLFMTYTIPDQEAPDARSDARKTITNSSNSIPTVEAAGIYRLASGQIFLGRECP